MHKVTLGSGRVYGVIASALAMVVTAAAVVGQNCWTQLQDANSCTRIIEQHHDPSCPEPEIIASISPCDRVTQATPGVQLATSLFPPRQCAVKVWQPSEDPEICEAITINTTVICQIAWGASCGGGGGEN
ncbi:MAG: hypothetical protein KIS87_05770 [Phycisphaeraceae bacterium]|nr:hypothetical protein [Phycisphaeraceae bacterium]